MINSGLEQKMKEKMKEKLAFSFMIFLCLLALGSAVSITQIVTKIQELFTK